MNNTNTVTAVSLSAVAAAIVTVSQTLIQFAAPQQFWELVQQATQFWSAIQVLVFCVLLGIAWAAKFVFNRWLLVQATVAVKENTAAVERNTEAMKAPNPTAPPIAGEAVNPEKDTP